MRRSVVHRARAAAALAFISGSGSVLVSRPALAKTIEVNASDGAMGFTKIENAVAGDEVVIGPGTYKYRVYLQATAPANNPIIIRAKDPTNLPVWDLDGTFVEDAPGSYTAPDRGRGCWQVVGTNYHISGIVFSNCRGKTPGASAGMRYYAGAQGLVLSGCIFRTSDNGLTGGSQTSEAAAEFCEFDRNGNTQANPPTHNVYVYGGKFALRYSYSHDATQGLDLHCRADDATIEYNWFSRGKGTEIQFDSPDFPPNGTYVRNIMFRGNVIVQAQAPANNFKVITLYNDEENTESIAFTATNNTLVGNGGNAAFVQLANSDGTVINANLSNNILSGTGVAFVIDDTAKGTVSGKNNWLKTGTKAGALTGSVFGSAPGFTGATDFTLSAASACVGQANSSATGVPTREYYKDEAIARQYRARATVKDIGAFEHDTVGPGTGPYGVVASDGGTGSDGGSPAGNADSGAASDSGGAVGGGGEAGGGGAGVAGDSPASGGDAGVPVVSPDSGGCSCRAVSREGDSIPSGGVAGIIVAVLGLWRGRRGSRRHSTT